MAMHASMGLALVAGLFTAAAAQAQTAGSLSVRLGATQIAPDVRSGDLTAPSLPGTRIDVKSDTQPTAGVTWMWTDAIAFDLPLAAGFKHDIVGAGAIDGVGKIADVKALPIMLAVQYRFLGAKAPVRPYIGLAPTYAKFYKARGTAALTGMTGGLPSNPTTLTVDSKFTATAQLGVRVVLSDKFALDAAVMGTPLKTRATLSTGQTIDIKINPVSFTLGVGLAF